MYLIMFLFSVLNFCVFLFSLLCGGFFAYINRALQRSPGGRARRAPFLARRILHFCGLFTKKFGLIFKGSPSTSSGQARECPHPLAAPSVYPERSRRAQPSAS